MRENTGGTVTQMPMHLRAWARQRSMVDTEGIRVWSKTITQSAHAPPCMGMISEERKDAEGIRKMRKGC